jgi:hypothetical protein
MAVQYKYVVVCSDGSSYEVADKFNVAIDGLITPNYHGIRPKTLPQLMTDGWLPDNETPMPTGGGGDARHVRGYVLIRLKKLS